MSKSQEAEPREHMINRLRMRSMRRGIKEMDILLTRFADAALESLSADDLEIYDALLWENDQDLYVWVTAQSEPPPRFTEMIKAIAELNSRK